MKWNNKGHEFDEVANHILEDDVSYWIWGAGTYGISFVNEYKDEFVIKGFFDSNPKKQETLCCGLPVLPPPKEKLKNGEKILVSAGWVNQIFPEIEKLGYIENKDFFHIDEFVSIYFLYKYDRFKAIHLGYTTTEKCSLRCKHCASFIPYIKQPKEVSKKQIMEDLEGYFQWVDNLNLFAISGGDAGLHSELKGLLLDISEKYMKDHKKIQNLEITVNAIFMPDQELLDILHRLDVFVRFTDYGKEAAKQQKIPELIAMLQEHEIRYDHVQFQNWYDCGYPQESNGLSGDRVLSAFFDRCHIRSCGGISEGRYSMCSLTFKADRADYCQIQPNDYFDFSTYEPNRRKEFMEFMLGYTEKGYYELCKKCNGAFNVNKTVIPVGEQL